jgi:phospholipid/cholesterol/gamma-HCH transport system substrate-binding protein
MPREIKHIKVGFFVSISLLLAMFVIFMMGSEKNVFRRHYTLMATFNDISGLRVGAPVQLAGVTVGFVDDIRFPKDLTVRRLEVVLRIAEKYKDRIREDSIATINTQGLLGDKYIFISIGSPDKPVLSDGAEIKTREVVGIFELSEKGSEILEEIKSAAESASRFFGNLKENKEDISSVFSSIKNILQQVEKGEGVFHSMLYERHGKTVGETLRHLHNASKNLDEITSKVNEGEGTIGALISDPSVYNDVKSLFGRANRSSVIRSIVQRMAEERKRRGY